MKRYLARVFSLHPLSLLAGVCLLCLAPIAGRWLWLAPGASERAARGAAQELAKSVVPPVLVYLDKKYEPLFGALQSLAGTVNGIPAMAHDLAKDVVKEVTDKAQAEVRHGVDQIVGPDGQAAAIAARLDERIGKESEGLHKAVDPLVVKVGALVDVYGGVPDRVAAAAEPSRRAIEAEITCRIQDPWTGKITGYGPCLRGRITALTGEWAKLGGILVQHWEAMLATFQKGMNGIAGIADVGNAWMEKNVRPKPTTFWGRVKAGFQYALAMLLALARSGAL